MSNTNSAALLPLGHPVGLFAVLKVIVGAIHVVDGLLLIFLVLLHSGKGGGLSDMFGGSIGQTAAGSTVVERNLDRITVVAALIFAFTTIGFALLLST
jgi:preprotein translocase subunit SecG